MTFKETSDQLGKLTDGLKKKVHGVRHVYCFPFYSMMLALNRTHIDYFSLDVEGRELEVLRTIPFDKLNISIFTIEFLHGKEGKNAYLEFMKTVGYRLHSTIISTKNDFDYDFVFVRNDFMM